MTRRFDHQLQQDIVTIHPGEYYATGEDVAIATILGSCIAVALYDEKLKQGGLNHFMLAETAVARDMVSGNMARFGMYAMELLINELLKSGSERKNLRAKVFGGGSVLTNTHGGPNKIPQDNINFAFNYLATEKIPVVAQDVGGTWPRKIFYFPKTSKVLLKRITKQVEKIAQEEKSYMETAQKRAARLGDITWF
jgi:chemotaxis protein CheD